MRMPLTLILFACLSLRAGGAAGQDVWNQVEHVYAESKDVSIHYAALGKGPLVVMLHGFPDFWYTWRNQMRALADANYRVAAVDLRGYNLSDKPKGVASYAMPLLVEDIAAVIAKENARSAIVVGHDWGGAIAWNVAMQRPELVELLVICNLPHPTGIARELINNPEQRKSSMYVLNFLKPDGHKLFTAESLASWVNDAKALPRYIDALGDSDFEAMLNYYKANFAQAESLPGTAPQFPKVKVPVLMFHGLKDQALLPGALNDTWQWLEKDLTLVTFPDAGHFVQQDAAEQLSSTLLDWLKRRRKQN